MAVDAWCVASSRAAQGFFFRYRTEKTDRLILIGKYDPEGKTGGWTLAQAIERARELGERLKTTPDLKEAPNSMHIARSCNDAPS